MASPGWLPQEVQSSTSQSPVSSSPPTASDSMPESAQTKFVQGPSFSYSVLPNVSPSGTSQQSSSGSVLNSNPPASTVVRQPLVPGLSSSPAPTFSYNISHTIAGLHGSQHFQSKTPIVPGNSQGEKNASPPAVSLQPPVPGQSAQPKSFVPGTALPIMPPPVLSPISIPKGVSSNSASFSFNGNPQLTQKDQSSKSNTSDAAAQDAGISSSASSIPQSFLLPAHTSSTASASSTPNLVPATLWMPMVPSFSVPPGMSGTPGTPGPPGIGQSTSSSSNLAVPSAVMDSSAALRPIMPAALVPSNPAVQQQIYPTYPSLPAIAASPQGLWLQPPQLGSSPRSQFLPYPAVFPGPFPLPARGMPLPSVPLPDSQPPGVTPVGTSGTTPTSSVTFGDQLVSSSGMPPELAPPQVDNNKHINDVGIKDGAAAANEQLDAWTAHKTDAGVIYYYNALTGESTYEKPSGFKGESNKVIVQPTPVSWEKLAGTDWALINTNDNKKYYYNTKTKLSSWQVPTEITELKKKQDVDTSKEHLMPVPSTNVLAEKVPAPNSLSAPAVNTGGRDSIALRPLYVAGSSSALDLIKKKLQDAGAPVTSSPVPALSGPGASELTGLRAGEATVRGLQSENSKDKLKDSNGDGNMSDSSSDSEDADSGPTKEQCIIQFKDMLKERGVAPFSKWEKELPKIVFDPRFKAIPSHSARRSLFERYVKTRAEEERKEKRAAQKAAIEGFKQLLEEASEDIDHNTDYQTFKMKWGNDPRFMALDRKDRELLLSERVLPLKRAADEKAQAIRAAAASSFKSMLRDKGDITKTTRWSRVKDSLRDDPRYKYVKHEDREILFNDYVSELKAAEEEAVRETKAKRVEQEKMKERERELRKRKKREEQEMEWVRLKVRRKEAVTSYQALLVETIKDPQASWTESKPKLEKDPQGRATNSDLDPADTEKLFREHVKMLHERCANEFRTLLAEVLTPKAAAQEVEDGKTVFNSWSAAKRHLKVDPRYTKMPRKERESLWRRYTDEMQRKQKVAGDQKEGKHTDGKSRASVDSGRFASESRRTHDRR